MMGTMSSIKEIMQFCRLCLVKDQVNVSIFEEHGDTRDVKRKISECLPVTVSEEDSLPKKICDGCLYKLELLYQFRTTCVSAEKQLQVWIAELNNSESKEDQDLKLQHSQTSVKEEIFDATDHPDNSEYVIEEQHISYEEGDIPYNESQDDNDDGDATNSSDDEPLAKRRKRFLEEQVQTDDTLKTADNKMAITKLEHESDDENVDDPEPNFVSVGTSDDQQPGPSGLNKMSATTTNAEMPIRVKEKFRIDRLKSKLDNEYTRKGKRLSKEWKCRKCDDSFTTIRSLKAHRKEAHSKVGQGLWSKYIYSQVENLYFCNICDKNSKTQEEMDQHVVSHDESYTCEHCGNVFQSAYKYSVHMRFHGSEYFHCTFCDYKTLRRTAILTHINNMHLKNFMYYCKFCGKGTDDRVKHREHENSHEGAKPFVCIVCNKIFLYSRYLLTHQQRYHKVTIDGISLPNQCHICKRTFSKAASLTKHLINHEKIAMNGGRTHLCDVCGKAFTGKEKLEGHYRMHTGDKPYSCSYCPKNFTKREYLVMHERIHSGEKPFSCEYCGKCFNQPAPLKIHVRGHTGERPYICHICKDGYISRTALNHHFKTCPGRTADQ
ncbi:zinc finger protein 431-like isoform X3 [Onthophagus taurus]|uniref:zinc finger protein 431-like isoform X3 n=1 Tax=Onthophagus taurus TaxID=166361 RepID=UPI000C202390|nr:zinc finger protein 2 homolog isoform X3 [Onthophagus taurus]